MARFPCPKCGEVITTPAEVGGKLTRCPNCGRPFAVLPIELQGWSVTWRFVMYVLTAVLFYLITVQLARFVLKPSP
jgi:hypothetical protein